MECQVCKCGDGQALSAEGTCHKCGHLISGKASSERRATVMANQERESQERARDFRKDPQNTDDGYGYLPPVGGDARPR